MIALDEECWAVVAIPCLECMLKLQLHGKVAVVVVNEEPPFDVTRGIVMTMAFQLGCVNPHFSVQHQRVGGPIPTERTSS